jgi:hypothetical protein
MQTQQFATYFINFLLVALWYPSQLALAFRKARFPQPRIKIFHSTIFLAHIHYVHPQLACRAGFQLEQDGDGRSLTSPTATAKPPATSLWPCGAHQ